MEHTLAPVGFRGVFLPTDYTEAGQYAFYHGLKLAMSARVPLRLLHVDPPDTISSWDDFPKVRNTLTRWLERDKTISADELSELGLSVRKSKAQMEDPTRAILANLKKHHGQLMVLAPHTHQGFAGRFHKSVSAALTRRSGGLSLLIPEDSQGFVDPTTGKVDLSDILIPVDHNPDAQKAMDAAEAIAGHLGLTEVRGHLLHVGETMPSLRWRPQAAWHWSETIMQGDPVSCILEQAERLKVRLIIMATEGRHGLLDKLRGSTTERVVRQATSAVLVVPAS